MVPAVYVARMALLVINGSLGSWLSEVPRPQCRGMPGKGRGGGWVGEQV